MLFVRIKPRCASNPNFLRNSCCGRKPVILISSRSILHSFLLEGAGPVRWPNTLPPCAILPVHAAYARVDLWKAPFWKEMPVTLWHCKSLFQEKARTNWWSNQPMLAICLSAVFLSPTFWITLSSQLQPRTCLGIYCGWQFTQVSSMQSCTYEYFVSFLWPGKPAQERAPESLFTYRLWNQEYFCWTWCHLAGKCLLGQKCHSAVCRSIILCWGVGCPCALCAACARLQFSLTWHWHTHVGCAFWAPSQMEAGIMLNFQGRNSSIQGPSLHQFSLRCFCAISAVWLVPVKSRPNTKGRKSSVHHEQSFSNVCGYPERIIILKDNFSSNL